MEDLELEEVCRLCLGRHEEMHLALEVGVIDKLLDCAAVVLPPDSLICGLCKNEVNKWYSFKQQVMKSLEIAEFIEEQRKKCTILENNYVNFEECFVKTEVEEEVDVKPDISQINEFYNNEQSGTDIKREVHSPVDNAYKCETCDKTFYSKIGLSNHNRTFHNPKTRSKKYSPGVSQEPDSSSQPKYQCDLCHKSFISETGLQWHKELHTSCNLDTPEDNPLLSKDELKIYSPADYAYKCEICEKPFYSKLGLSNHKKTYHSNKTKPQNPSPSTSQEPVPSSTTQDKYQCDLCHKSFNSKMAMMWHKQLHSALQLDTSQGKPLFSCPKCPMTYEKKKSLIDHMKWKHSGTGQICICDFCGKYCKSKSDFRAHTRTHKGEKQFKCGICSRSFVTVQNLVLHESVHTDMVNESVHTDKVTFMCTHCGRRFRKRSYLLSHQATHERPYKCELCDKTFGRKQFLKNHLESH